jgi:hypothetical protein
MIHWTWVIVIGIAMFYFGFLMAALLATSNSRGVE